MKTNALFPTAGRFFFLKKCKNLKNLYQQLHNSSKWLSCDGYKLSNHNDAIKKKKRRIEEWTVQQVDGWLGVRGGAEPVSCSEDVGGGQQGLVKERRVINVIKATFLICIYLALPLAPKLICTKTPSWWPLWHFLPFKKTIFNYFFFVVVLQKSLTNVGSLCIEFLLARWLLHHLDPEGDAAQKLVPFVVVAQVGALYPALHRQLLVVVVLGEQQLYSHQGLHVILLHREGDRHLSIIHSCRDTSGHGLMGGKYLHGLSCRSRGNTSCQCALHWGNTAFVLGCLSVRKIVC